MHQIHITTCTLVPSITSMTKLVTPSGFSAVVISFLVYDLLSIQISI